MLACSSTSQGSPKVPQTGALRASLKELHRSARQEGALGSGGFAAKSSLGVLGAPTMTAPRRRGAGPVVSPLLGQPTRTLSPDAADTEWQKRLLSRHLKDGHQKDRASFRRWPRPPSRRLKPPGTSRRWPRRR